MVDIVTCPKCARPRALGHRCPSCGDAATATGEQGSTPDTGQSWHQQADAGGFSATTPFAAQAQSVPSQKKGGSRLVTFVVAAALIVVGIVVAVVLMSGGAAIVEEEAAVASAPNKASDLAAESLIRNAMTAFDAVAVESGSFEGIGQSTLQTMEPAITWLQGSAGLCSSPPTGANQKQNVVAWVSTGPMSYELGTWSASGVEIGVRVDRMGGGITYYKDGQAANW